MRIIVVLPAPLLPSRPTISFFSTWKLTLLTARTLPKYLVNRSTWIMVRVNPVVVVRRGKNPHGTCFLGRATAYCKGKGLEGSLRPARSRVFRPPELIGAKRI